MMEDFSYNFSYKQAKDLVLFLRKHQEDVSFELEPFMNSLENFFYSSMTVSEAEEFFHEKSN